MLQTSLLLSFFPDFHRIFADRNPFANREKAFFLSLFGLVDQLNKTGKPVSESVLLALFLVPFLQAIMPQHPFLGERERAGYLAETIRWTIHQVMNPFSFAKGIKEITCQILIAQFPLRKALERGAIPKRLRAKKYFKEATLLFGIQAKAKGEKMPRILQNAVSADLLPWWPKRPEKGKIDISDQL
jgi:hypothetical protein